MTASLLRRRGALAAGAALMLLTGGCAGGNGVRHNDDGTLSVQCPGGYHDWSRCHQRAAEACRPGGFEIVSRVSNEGSSGVGVRDWTTAGSEVTRTMVVRCTP